MYQRNKCMCRTGHGLSNIGSLLNNHNVRQKGGSFYPSSNYNYSYKMNHSQYGGGVGSVFAALGRVLIPLVKQGFTAFKKHGINAGLDLLQSVQDQPIKEYIASKSDDVIKNITKKGIEKLKKMQGAGRKKL